MNYLEFEVIPEVSLRNDHVEFLLGMPLCQVLNSLQHASRFIRNIELTYCQKEPLSGEIILNLSHDGIRLNFEPCWHRLKLIEVYDLSKIALSYCSSVFSKPDDQATVEKIESFFGATHPGVFDTKLQVYLLNWRGLSFCFITSNEISQLQAHSTHGLSSLRFSNGSSPTVAKMCIFKGATLADAKLAALPLECYLGTGQLHSVRAIKCHDSIRSFEFTFSAEVSGTSSSLSNVFSNKYTRNLSFGDSEQIMNGEGNVVMSILGSPSRIFYKSEDKMRIHRSSGHRICESDDTDFFFNYFTLGVDVLFDSRSRSLKKFVFHTNYPGHFDFGIYSRCQFEIEIESKKCPSEISTRPTKFLLTPLVKFDEFSRIICDCDVDKRLSTDHPVVLNRTSSSGMENPFGSTFCYGHDQLIIEVMESGYIATVTIFG